MTPVLRSIAAAGLACVLLAACGGEAPAPTPPDEAASPPAADNEPAPPPSEDACNATRYVNLIGRPATMPGVPEASRDVRHIHPDTQVTMDYRPDRLNIDIDANGVITGFRCG